MSSEHVPVALRRVVAARASERCEYCQIPDQFATQSFAVGHIQPRSTGGETVMANLAWSCFGCNSHKSIQTAGIDPQSGDRIAIFNPRQQTWREHFAWNEDTTLIIGRT